MVGYKKLGLVLGAAAMFALMPAKVDAQFIRYSPIFWSFDAGAGVAIPVGDLSDVSKAGFSAGIGGAYFLNPRFAIIVEGSADFLKGKEGSSFEGGMGPDLRAWHYTAGFEGYLTDPVASSFLAAIDVGAGGATFDTDRFTVVDLDCSGTTCTPSEGAQTTATYSKTYFALNGGVTLGYGFSKTGPNMVPLVTLYVAGDFHYMFGKEEDSKALAGGYGVDTFGGSFVIPITAGLRINIP